MKYPTNSFTQRIYSSVISSHHTTAPYFGRFCTVYTFQRNLKDVSNQIDNHQKSEGSSWKRRLNSISLVSTSHSPTTRLIPINTIVNFKFLIKCVYNKWFQYRLHRLRCPSESRAGYKLLVKQRLTLKHILQKIIRDRTL